MDVLLRMRPLSGWIRHDLDGVVVEKHGLVVAGALVRQNTRIPSGEVYFFLKVCIIISSFVLKYFYCYLDSIGYVINNAISCKTIVSNAEIITLRLSRIRCEVEMQF
ncbi:Uncharacterized protein Rs2_01745 [Raphanus sativus]|nr:Uncharacterized protein Rs2_01745 [Raphanus sativus]